MQEKVPSEGGHVKPRLERRVSAAQTRRCISSKKSCNGSAKRPSKTVHNVLMRSEAEKKSTQATAQGTRPRQKTTKHEVHLTFFNADFDLEKSLIILSSLF